MSFKVNRRCIVLSVASTTVLAIIACSKLAFCESVNDFTITQPLPNANEWDGRVTGRGCRPGHTVEVFIRTDIDYPQGYASCGSSSTWQLQKTYPTRGVKNKVFAILYGPNGIEVARSNSVVLDLKAGPVESRKKIPIETTPSLTIDVDVNIPKTGVRNKDAVAVVIGNSNYESADIPRAEYALNDASIVREYLINQFGYLDGNIIYVKDAKLSNFNSVFGTETKPRGMLARYVKPGISDVFIYYSGHGFPDVETKKAYFVPVDCDLSSIDVNGYSLDVLYKNVSMIDAKSITIVIEACFSGNSAGGLLLEANPISFSVSQEALIKGTVITSSSGEQVSAWYPEKQHSLFTYFFLKGISGASDKDQNKRITIGELTEYLTSRTEGVPYWAGRIGINQTPTVHGDKSDVLVRY